MSGSVCCKLTPPLPTTRLHGEGAEGGVALDVRDGPQLERLDEYLVLLYYAHAHGEGRARLAATGRAAVLVLAARAARRGARGGRSGAGPPSAPWVSG